MSGKENMQLMPMYWHPYFMLWMHAYMGNTVNSWDKSSATRHFIPKAVRQWGFKPGSDLENRVSLALASYGFSSIHCDVRQEFRIGRFRADFCIVNQNTVIEVDGIHHTHSACVEKDLRRDFYFAENGWATYRVDCSSGHRDVKETIPAQVAAIALTLISDRLGSVEEIHPEHFALESEMSDFNFLKSMVDRQNDLVQAMVEDRETL